MIQRAESKEAQQIHASHMFLKNRVAEVVDGSVAVEDRFQVCTELMKKRNEEYRLLPVAEVLALRVQARDLRIRKRELTREYVELKRRKIADLQAQECERFKNGLPNHIGAARLSIGEQKEACTSLDTKAVQEMRLGADMGIAATAPRPPDEEERNVYNEMIDELPMAPVAQKPWVCRWVCPHRHLYTDVAIARGGAGAREFWLILYATQSPYGLTFLQLRKRRRDLLPNREYFVAEPGGPWANTWDYAEYDFLPTFVRNERDLAWLEAEGDLSA